MCLARLLVAGRLIDAKVSEDDLRMAAQKTTMYVDTLPTKRVSG
jgi:hypothetical protein